MPIDQLDQFMQAIGTFESGNNYDARGPYTGSQYGRAQGRYQIMETIYPGWAREAGVDPSDMSQPAQDKVARHKMRQYYARYGSWELVAVAWFAGPGRADKAKRAGVSSLAGISDVIGTSVPKYVENVIGLMGKTSAPENPRQADLADSVQRPSPLDRVDLGDAAPSVTTASYTDPLSAGSLQDALDPVDTHAEQQQRSSIRNKDVLGEIFGAISAMARERGNTGSLDARTMIGQGGVGNG